MENTSGENLETTTTGDAGGELHASELDETTAAGSAGEQLEGEQLEGVHASGAGEQLEGEPLEDQPEPSPLEIRTAQLAQRVISLGLVLERVAAAVVKIHGAQHGTHTSTVHDDIGEIRAYLADCEAARAEAAAANGAGG